MSARLFRLALMQGQQGQGAPGIRIVGVQGRRPRLGSTGLLEVAKGPEGEPSAMMGGCKPGGPRQGRRKRTQGVAGGRLFQPVVAYGAEDADIIGIRLQRLIEQLERALIVPLHLQPMGAEVQKGRMGFAKGDRHLSQIHRPLDIIGGQLLVDVVVKFLAIQRGPQLR